MTLILSIAFIALLILSVVQRWSILAMINALFMACVAAALIGFIYSIFSGIL